MNMNNNREILSKDEYDKLVKNQIEISKVKLEKAFEKTDLTSLKKNKQ